MINQFHHGNSLDILKTFPAGIANSCITSPPYFALRDYGNEKTWWPEVEFSILGFKIIIPAMQCSLGLEPEPNAYIGHLILIFREVHRCIKDDGTCWINIGDSYWGSGKAGNNPEYQKGHTTFGAPCSSELMGKPTTGKNDFGLKPKDLIGIPWMLAFALRDDGWFLRQDIIWHKPNPMPESVTDRCTKAHEYFFMLSKKQKYYFDQDAIKVPITDATVARLNQQLENQTGSDRVPGKTNGNMKAVGAQKFVPDIGPGRIPRPEIDRKGGNQANEKGIPAMAINGNGVKGHSGYFDNEGNLIGDGKANKKSVWTIPTKPFTDAHFAVFPDTLIIDPIKASCPEGGTVLDPFGGSGTTAEVCARLNRNFILIDQNEKFIKMQKGRLNQAMGMFNPSC